MPPYKIGLSQGASTLEDKPIWSKRRPCMPSRREQQRRFKRRIRELEKERTAREMEEEQQVHTEEEILETLRWQTTGEFSRDIRLVGSMQLPLATMIPQIQAFLDSDEDMEHPLPYTMPPFSRYQPSVCRFSCAKSCFV